MDALASKVKFYDAVECWNMPEAIAELAKLTKFLQLSLVVTAMIWSLINAKNH